MRPHTGSGGTAPTFHVVVADLVHRPGARRRERVSGRLGALRVMDTSVDADSVVEVDTLLEWVSDGILATGEVSAPWEAACRRCLRPVVGEANARFQELFEASPREGETYLLRREHIDLEPLAREVLLLELPLAPLCGAECRGLCPTCGAELNQGPCGCPPADADHRWFPLDELRKHTE